MATAVPERDPLSHREIGAALQRLALQMPTLQGRLQRRRVQFALL